MSRPELWVGPIDMTWKENGLFPNIFFRSEYDLFLLDRKAVLGCNRTPASERRICFYRKEFYLVNFKIFCIQCKRMAYSPFFFDLSMIGSFIDREAVF